MSEILNLSIRKIQEYVGDELLDELNNLLQILDKDFVDGSIDDNKEMLERIFISFGGAEMLSKGDFRRDLFQHLEPNKLKSIIRELGKSPDADFEKNVNYLVSLGWKPGAESTGLLELLGLPISLAPKLKNKISVIDKIHYSGKRYRSLLDYQYSVYFASIEKLKIPRSRFVIQMPTGSGKTRTAIEIICNFINEHKCDVIWLAHSAELCGQAAETFNEIWQFVGAFDINLIRYYGDVDRHEYVNNGTPNFIVSSFQKMYSKIIDSNEEIDFIQYENIRLVVVDEAHKVTAPTYEKVTKKLIGDNTSCIGLTATPGRSLINLQDNEKLAKFFFENIITFDSKDMEPIDYLKKKKILSQAVYSPIETNINFELTLQEKISLEKFLELPNGFLAKIGKSDIRNAEIVKRLKSYADTGKRILFFGCSVEHSKFICSVLSYLGVGSVHIDGTTRQEVRDFYINQFRTGEVLVLCNFEVLSTGFDAPKTDVVFISRPTSSIVLYSQMIGRGLRGPAVGGTETCIIVDVKDNIIGYSDHNKTYTYFEEFWSSN